MKLRYLRIVFGALLGFCLFSCNGKDPEPYQFTKVYDPLTLVFDTTSQTGNLIQKDFIVETDIIQTLGDKGFTVFNLNSARLSEANIQVITPGATLSHFSGFNLYLKTPAGSFVSIAQITSSQLSSTQASFQSADEDLRTVFTLPELTVRLETNLDSVIQPAAISLRLDMAFDLKASLND